MRLIITFYIDSTFYHTIFLDREITSNNYICGFCANWQTGGGGRRKQQCLLSKMFVYPKEIAGCAACCVVIICSNDIKRVMPCF